MSLTPAEADAWIVNNSGLSYDQVEGLGMYKKRLLLGYKEVSGDNSPNTSSKEGLAAFTAAFRSFGKGKH